MDRRSGVVLIHGLLLLHLTVYCEGLAMPKPQCPGVPPDRGERLFFLAPRVPPQRKQLATITKTYTSTRVISEVWLSSCVTYATALPKCPRNARGDKHRNRMDPRDMDEEKIALNPTRVQPILSTEAPHLPEDEFRKNERQLRMFSQPFWEDLVGLAFPLRSGQADRPTPPLHSVPSTQHRDKSTVTRTITVTDTTRVKGPKTVVSFSITGCLPSKLPFDLERCNEPKQMVPSLRIPLEASTEEPETDEPSTVPPTETPSSPDTTEAPLEEPATNDPTPITTEQGNTSELPAEETSPEAEQMMPAPNTSGVATETPEDHEELGSGFSK